MSENDAQPGAGRTFFVPLRDEEFGALGQITAQFGQIEGVIDGFIMALSGVNNFNIYQVLCGSAPFGAKLKIVDDLVDTYRGALPSAGEIKAATKALKKASLLRNHAVHGAWGMLHDAILEGPDQTALQVGEGRVAAPSGRKDGKPMMASDLDSLLEIVEVAARQIYEAYAAATGGGSIEYPLRRVFAAPE